MPIWFSGGGPLINNRWDGELFKFEGGQCLSCPFAPPTAVGSLPLSIEFTAADKATVSLGGFTFNIQRFPFGFDHTALDFLGEWGLLIGSFAHIADRIGDRVTFVRTEIVTDNLTAIGSRTGAPDRLAVGYKVVDDMFAILVSGITIDELMVFNFDGFNRLVGRYWVYGKDGFPTGAGLEFVGVRIHQTAGLQKVHPLARRAAGEVENMPRVAPQPVITAEDADWEWSAQQAFDLLERLLK